MRFEPFDVSDAQWAKRLDSLRFGGAKWDLHVEGRPTVARGALVLTRQEHEEAVAVAESLAALSLKAQGALWKERDPTLGLDPVAMDLASLQEPGPYVTRIDLFRTPSGWVASEFNDDVPGGYNEAIALPAVLQDLSSHPVAGDLPDALVALLGHGDGPVGLVYATGYAEDLQVIGLLAALLGEGGIDTVPAAPSNLSWSGGTARLLGQEVASLFRFFPSEWFARLGNLSAWREALAAMVPVTNPFPCAWTQSKASFAWLRQNARGMDADLVERCLPGSWPLDAARLEELRGKPDGWVLKPAFGRMGEGVVVAQSVPPVAWQRALQSAWHTHATRPFIAQRQFRPVPLEVAPGSVRTVCVGTYVVAGRFAGYYSRMQEGPVVAYDATNLLTVVEGV